MSIVSTSHGQYYLFNNEPPRLDLKFTRHSIEAVPGKTIFNVLKIINKSNQAQTFNLILTVPSGWSVVGSPNQELTISPIDSILVPVRVAIGENVRGDIGYSIIATVADIKGNPLKNEYSFVKIPRKTDLRVKFLTRIDYLDQQTGQSTFNIRVENKGNREEIVSFLIESDFNLGIGSARLNLYSADINIPPFTDSIVSYNVFHTKSEYDTKNLFKVHVTAKTIDTTYQGTVWFRNLENSLTNEIPSTKKYLVAEVFSKGLFASYSKPIYSALINGNILLKKNREFFYLYSNNNSTSEEDFYKTNRMWLGYKDKYLNITLGDINSSIESSLQGRGGIFAVKFNKFSVEFIGTKGVIYNQTNMGGLVKLYPFKNFGLFFGGASNESIINNIDSKLGLVGLKFRIFKDNNFIIQTSYNNIKFGKNPQSLYSKESHGIKFNYNSRIGSLTNSLSANFGERYYNSSYNGRREIYGTTMYNFKNNSLLLLYFTDSRNHPGNYSISPDSAQSYTNYSKGVINYGFYPVPRLYVYAGPGVDLSSSDIFPAIKTGTDYFSTISQNLIFGFKYRGLTTGNSLSTQVILGRVDVPHYATVLWGNPIANTSKRPAFFYQYFSFNLRMPKWGFQTIFSNGPKSIYEQYSWFYASRTSRMLKIMPYYNSFIFKRNAELLMNVAYSNDLVSKSSFVNFTTQLYYYFPKEWTLRLLSVYSLQQRLTSTETSERFQNIYFELSLRKEFGMQQPRQKFYNLDFLFFKDYNGDRIKNENEPGIKNVLINIQRIDEGLSEYSDFVSGELLSDQLGRVSFQRIPAGTYQITYNTIGNEAGTFTKSDVELSLNLDKNSTLNIPFVEKNKVFGKIILSRSRLSGLGKMDVSNVRITATDSKGRTYTTLTDKNGEFVIFAPVTDQYNVNINNIFYENFDLRQNNFKVQFNGYKQFEVNFVFDEKIRRINFSPSSQDNQLASVLQIRRTNLRGTVKDANSIAPIRARVNLVNTKTNTVLSSMYSSSQTGDYNIAFMADDSYLLEVLADGYWYHSENLNLNQVTTFLNVTKDVMLKPIAIGSKIELNIRFEINKTDLKPESVAELNRLIRLLKDNGNIKIEIQGHSDDLEALSNTQISEDRAKVVARYLIENGFSNLQIRGFGNTVPVSSNDTEQGRSNNRRVEVEVVSK